MPNCNDGHWNDGTDTCERCGEDLNTTVPVATSSYLNRPCLSERERRMADVLRMVDEDVRHHLRSDDIAHALLRKHVVAEVRALLSELDGAKPAKAEG